MNLTSGAILYGSPPRLLRSGSACTCASSPKGVFFGAARRNVIGLPEDGQGEADLQQNGSNSHGPLKIWFGFAFFNLRVVAHGLRLCPAVENFLTQSGPLTEGDGQGVSFVGEGELEAVKADAGDAVEFQQESVGGQPAAFAGEGEFHQCVGGESFHAVESHRAA